MSERDDKELDPLVAEFRTCLEECEDLYRDGALEYARSQPHLGEEWRREFVHGTLTLHRCLVLKIFTEVAYIDRRWHPEALALAGELLEHVWHRRLNDREVKEKLHDFMEQTGMKWDALLGPFEQYAPFRQRAPQLEAVVMRLANLIAKADGRVTAQEVRQLQWIQAEAHRVLERIPLCSPGESRPRAAAGQQALKPAPPATARAFRPLSEAQEQKLRAIEQPAPARTLEETLAELEALIGLAPIKQEVRGLVNYLKMQKAREQFGLPTTSISLHSVFSGNPGTGKTTVARLLGDIFGAMGILPRGHLVETDRSGLVAEYAGQTAPKAHKRIDEALDGVLFIDEAYSLVAEDGDDPYGAEALQVLLKRMEDDRDRLVVVLAGYPEPLERLIKSNPGLSSRFSRQFTFPDYSAAEMGRITETLCSRNRYVLPALTRVKLLLGFQYLLDHRDENFGNGRLVRNMFEQAIGRLANRITGVAPLTREILTTLTPEDFVMPEVPASVWHDLESGSRSFHTVCPHCRHPSRLPQPLLGHKVQCKQCHESFPADWGEVVPAE